MFSNIGDNIHNQINTCILIDEITKIELSIKFILELELLIVLVKHNIFQILEEDTHVPMEPAALM